MADQSHLDILAQGVEAWNSWRERNPSIEADLSHANLEEADLSYANLGEADLSYVSEVRIHGILGSSPGRVTGRFPLHSLYTFTVLGDASFVALPCGSVHYIIAAATGVLIETSAPAQGIVAVAAAQVIPAAAAFKSVLPFIALDCVIPHAAA